VLESVPISDPAMKKPEPVRGLAALIEEEPANIQHLSEERKSVNSGRIPASPVSMSPAHSPNPSVHEVSDKEGEGEMPNNSSVL
jgi:hypothetical protein